ncbi:MAG: hypothetical protein R3B40_08180 [Polyangiales bacterium]|nr:hypothetical protein [Myxococcales bacterium]
MKIGPSVLDAVHGEGELAWCGLTTTPLEWRHGAAVLDGAKDEVEAVVETFWDALAVRVLAKEQGASDVQQDLAVRRELGQHRHRHRVTAEAWPHERVLDERLELVFVSCGLIHGEPFFHGIRHSPRCEHSGLPRTEWKGAQTVWLFRHGCRIGSAPNELRDSVRAPDIRPSRQSPGNPSGLHKRTGP